MIDPSQSPAGQAMQNPAGIIADELQAPKPWWHSTGVLAALALGVSTIARLVGYEVDHATLVTLLHSALDLALAALAWWGRVKAIAPIDRRLILPGLSLPKVAP